VIEVDQSPADALAEDQPPDALNRLEDVEKVVQVGYD
jgi:hypothetical protein